MRKQVTLKQFKVQKLQDVPVSIIGEVCVRQGPLNSIRPYRYNSYEYGIFEGRDKLCNELVNEFDKLHLYGEFPGITTPYIYAGVEKSMFTIHQEDCLSISVNICYSGIKTWHLIHKDDIAKLLKAIKGLKGTILHDDYLKCSAILQHKNLFFDTSFFTQNRIRFIVFVQRPGDVIITTPGSIHQGINTTANYNAAVNLFTSSHLSHYMEKVLQYCTHSAGCGMDNVANGRLFSLFKLHDSGRHVLTAEEKDRGNATQKRRRLAVFNKLAIARKAKAKKLASN